MENFVSAGHFENLSAYSEGKKDWMHSYYSRNGLENGAEIGCRGNFTEPHTSTLIYWKLTNISWLFFPEEILIKID